MRRPVTAALLSVSLLVGLSACGTGLQAQVYKARTPGDSSNGQLGEIALRGLAISLGSTNGAVLLTGVIVNNGSQADALVNADSTDAPDVQLLTATGAMQLPLPAGGTSGTQWALQLGGLAQAPRPGTFLPVTFEFAKAGRVTISVPVRTGDAGLTDREPLRDPYGE